MSAVQALHAALALARTPQLAQAMRLQPLPPGVTTLLRIAAGEDEPLRAAALATGRERREVVEAVELYVQRVMLYPGAPSSRVLGVEAGADRASARAHMRLLMLWLHPDRGSSEWRAAFARRVLASWRSFSAGETTGSVPAQPPGVRLRTGARRAKQGRRRRGLQLPWVAVPLAPRPKARRWGRMAGVAVAAIVFAATLLLPSSLPGDFVSAWRDADQTPSVTELSGEPAAVAPGGFVTPAAAVGAGRSRP